MTPPRSRAVIRLANAVSKGQPIDWQEEKTASPELNQTLDCLKVVENVLRGYRSLAESEADPRLQRSRKVAERDAPATGGPVVARASTPAVATPAPTGSAGQPRSPLFRWGLLDVLEKIGQGAFGEVYRAYDPALDREVALKLWNRAAFPGATADSFLSEARRLARVRHPNVLVVHGADEHDDRAGMWTDLIRGQTLENLLAQQGAFGAQEAALIGTELCRALAAMHAVDLVHRDVKTTNVMREEGGRIVLMDFGAAAVLTPHGSTNPDEPAKGTPLTLAPEQLFGSPASPNTDLYSLGVLLYRLLTVHYPVEARTFDELCDRHRHGERTPLREHRPDLPTRLVVAVEQALESEPDRRYRSAATMERKLAASLGALGAVSRTPRVSAASPSRLPPHNLPLTLTGFVDREREIATCAQLLEKSRWLSLTGPAERGKTRLALGLAEMLWESFPDGIWLIELDAHPTNGGVARAVATTLGLAPTTNEQALDMIVDRVKSARALLILDHGDSVLEDVTRTGQALLAACPNLKIIATSREPVAFPRGESFEVPPPSPSAAAADAADADRAATPLATVPFVGRRAEFDLLRDSLERARQGAGRTILLGGEAGIGKSRLMSEFRTYAESRHVVCLQGRCAYHGGRNFEPFVEALEELARRTRLPTMALVAESTRGRPALGALFSMLHMLLDPGAHGAVQLRTREQVWYLLDALLKRMAQHEALVLFLDDLHWADEGTLSLLNHVTRSVGNSRLLIVGSYRPEEIGASAGQEHPLEDVMRLLSSVPAFQRLPLAPLDGAETAALLEQTIRDPDLGRRLATTIHDRAQGNPFFTVEIVRELLSEKSGLRTDGTTRQDLVLPQTVTDVLMRRLSRLSQEERDLVDLAAVEGERFRTDTLAAGTGLTRMLLLKRLRGLEQTHQLIATAEGGYRFAHGLIREVLLRDIPIELRREYHGVVAAHLTEVFGERPNESGRVGYHLFEAQRFDDAVPFLLGAAREARRLFLHDRALQYLDQALEALGRSAQPALNPGEIRRSKSEVLLLLGRPEAARAAAERALEEDVRRGDESGRAASQEALGEAALEQGDLVAAESLLTDARNRFAASGDRQQIARCEHKLGALAARRGDFERGLHLLETALATARATGVELGVARILLDVGDLCYRRGDYPRALETFEAAVGDLQRLGERLELARALNRLGNALFQSGRTDQALVRYEQAMAPTIELGDLQGMAKLKANLGNVHLVRGDSERALDCYRDAFRRFEEIGDKGGMAQALVALGNASFTRGDFGEAARCYTSSLGPREEMGDRWGLANSLDNLGVVEYHLGRWRLALEHQQAAFRHRHELGDRPGCIESTLNLGSLMAVMGDVGAAERLYIEAERMAAEIGDPRRRARILLAQACLKLWAEDLDGASELLETARSLAADESLVRSRLLLLEGLVGMASAASDAESVLNEALAESRRTESIPDETSALLALAEMMGRLGRQEEAWIRTEEALDRVGEGRVPLLELHALRLRREKVAVGAPGEAAERSATEHRIRTLVEGIDAGLPPGLDNRMDLERPRFPLP